MYNAEEIRLKTCVVYVCINKKNQSNSSNLIEVKKCTCYKKKFKIYKIKIKNLSMCLNGIVFGELFLKLILKNKTCKILYPSPSFIEWPFVDGPRAADDTASLTL